MSLVGSAALQAAVPAQPPLIKITQTQGQIVLSWSPVSDATSYSVRRKVVGGAAYAPLISGITTTSYTDTGAQSGTNYVYVVAAVNSEGESQLSPPALPTAWGIGEYDVYVDSVGGSDSNSGGSVYEPLASLAVARTAILAKGPGASLALKRGSHWRESLDFTGVPNLKISSYGTTGPQPVIDGADIVTNWSATPAQSTVYQATVLHDTPNNTYRLTVYEDGLLLTRVADIAIAQSTPGSFVDKKGSDGSPVTVYIHPKDSGNPTTSGKTYEVSVRTFGLVAGEGSTINGVHTQRVTDNNGSLNMVNVPASTIRKTLAAWGTKHNIGIGSGSVSDSVTYAADPPTSYEPSNTALVAYQANIPPNTSYLFERVGCLQPEGIGPGGAVATAHSSDDTLFGSGTFRQCWVKGRLFFGAPGSTSSWEDETVEGCYSDRSFNLGMARGNVRYALAYSSSAYGAANVIATAKIENSAAYVEARYPNGNYNEVFRLSGPADVTISESAFSAASTPDGVVFFGNTTADSGTLDINHTVFYSGYQHLQIIPGLAYTGDFNVFWQNSSPSIFFRSYRNGVQYDTLSSWQTATGQDTHSVYLKTADQTQGNPNAFWLGVASNQNSGPQVGDFRVNPNARVYGGNNVAYIGTFPDGVTPITKAGPQSHWDWNARKAAPGAPAGFPNVPETLEEAKQYVVAPENWAF